MAGIVGAIGPDAVAATSKMGEVLEHRGGVQFCTRGILTNGTEYAACSLGSAKFNQASSNDGVSITVSDVFNNSYARARIINSRVLNLDRDCIGSRPLFYGTSDEHALCAFASERKALWSIGVRHARRVDPGSSVAICQPDHVDIVVQKPLRLTNNNSALCDETSAVNGLRKVLKEALDRVSDEELGVAFSGGLDSSLLCKLMESPKGNQYYAVGMANSHDLKTAQNAAHLLDIDLQPIRLDLDLIETYIPRVIEAIESYSTLDVAIALPMYVLEEHAKTAGLSSILTGQGADELFAGYFKYASLSASTDEMLREVLQNDVFNIARDNLERDNLAVAAHGLNLILPYLDLNVVLFGLTLNSSLKLRNGVNKYILRKVAEQVMPRELAYQQKKAIQYGTGVSAALRRLARKAKQHTDLKNGKFPVALYLQSIVEKNGINVAE
jgi:asparagine synthase (glutamine-hydrolysing)